MKQTIEIKNPINISMDDLKAKHENIKTIKFSDELDVELSDDNFSELRKAMTPQNFKEFINAFNTLIDFGINKGWRIYDDVNPEWHVSTIDYNEKSDKLYFHCEED